MRAEQRPQDATECPGKGHDDDKWVKPALEVDDQQQIHEEDCEHNSRSESDKRLVHALDLAAHCQGGSLRQVVLVLRENLVDLACHASQVSPLNVCINIKNRLNVVVVDVLGALAAIDRRKVAE